MTTTDFITELFCRVDDAMKGAKKHSQANLYPSEVVTLAILFALKGVGYNVPQKLDRKMARNKVD